ncbi:uncharacterized protein J8A68_000131 [[Candida] subhashii]|uniref:Uncharacterized protein n=1 Tax=[Candida] subhashii TaxID=561895 RepID=A0A8J5QTW7_9ASCO|nr:uncharacterized protein J8A68_000131 [[Candida] subhashii]KAG7666341.1 hypothetical protein J8A68_000131 [[Candida] subhashii]
MHEKIQSVYQINVSSSSSIRTKSHYNKFVHEDTTFNYTRIQYSVLNLHSIPKQLRTHSQPHEKPTVLIASSIGQSEPYGQARTFGDFVHTVNSISSHQENRLRISLGLLCNNPIEFANITNYIETNSDKLSKLYEKITLISAPFLDKNAGFSREERQSDNIQRLRRRLIAKSRNFLLSNVLEDEQYTFFLDADVVFFDYPENVISTFIKTEKDIIVPRVTRGGNQDYDKNSWRGQRTKPSQEELDLMDKNQWDKWGYVPYDVDDKMWHFQSYVDDNHQEHTKHKDEHDYIVPLDSVGGAVLFAKSVVYKQGAIFPTSNIIGTSWDRSEGYDGIETEGLCYLAKPLGYSCWGMPNVVAHHSLH